jgi:hypothetical protein
MFFLFTSDEKLLWPCRRGGWTGGHVHSLTNQHNVSTFVLRNKNKAKEIKKR